MKKHYGKTGAALREADTESGRVRGVHGNNPRITVFKGIPYAAPPVGELRWRRPQPAEKWEGTRLCDKYSNIPFQFNIHTNEESLEEMSEDCLYMNIFTPAKSKEEKLPVLLWIYGGAFVGGYAHRQSYDGEGMAQRGVVFVSFNYRAGPLGLMAHPELAAENDEGISGNYYYFDQIAALKWVRRNIESFGGDPDRITIMGHSSGSCACVGLTTTPFTKGDIVGACIHSSALARDFDGPAPLFVTPEVAHRRAEELMGYCGCATIAEMRALSPEQLLEGMRQMKEGIFSCAGNIDGYLFPDNPTAIYYRGENHDINYIFGSAADEGERSSAMLDRSKIAEYSKNFGDEAEAFVEFAATLRNEDLYDADKRGGCMRNRQIGESQIKNGMKPVYLFCFTRRAPGDNAGAFHGAENPYIFETLHRDWRPYCGSDYELSDKMADYFSNFVYAGNPNGEGLVRWTPYTADCHDTMMFDTTPFMAERPLSKIQLYKINYFLTHDSVDSMI